MSDYIITVRDFSKSFGTKRVIDSLSFEVEPGEIFAFLGPNGSGKTTTIRSLLGIYQSDSGTLLINGKRFTSRQAKILGYMPEERGLYLNSTVMETLCYFGQIKGLSAATAKRRALEFLHKVELETFGNQQISKLSSGQQQKIQLGITIINKPKLLILDEPTKGLDPVGREMLMDILLELNRQGTTIVFSTHQMNEVEQIADRLIMLHQGKRALYGKVDEIKRSFGSDTITVHFSGSFVPDDDLFSAKVSAHEAILTPKEGTGPQTILKYLIERNLKISRFTLDAPSLNDIFIQLTKDSHVA